MLCYLKRKWSDARKGHSLNSSSTAYKQRSLGRARGLKILFKIFARSNEAARCQVLAATWRLKFETNVDANSYKKTKKSWEIMQNMHAAWNQSLLQAKLNGKPIRSVFGLFRYLPWRQRPTCMKGASAQGASRHLSPFSGAGDTQSFPCPCLCPRLLGEHVWLWKISRRVELELRILIPSYSVQHAGRIVSLEYVFFLP